MGLQSLQNPFGHRARPEDQRPTAVQSAGHRSGYIDGRRADGGGMAAQHRLPTHPPPGSERTYENGLDQMVGGPRRLRDLIGAAYLAQDLALPQDLRIETRGHSVEVPNRGRAVQPGHRMAAVDPSRPGEILEPWAEIVVATPVHLAPIAGGEEHGAPAGQTLRRQPRLGLRRG